MLELRTLGTLDLLGVERAQATSVLAQGKRFGLLVYLATARPRGFHRRDALLSLFWPDHDERHARGALRNALYFLRQCLGVGLLVNRGPQEVGLGDGHLRHDVGAFDEALLDGDVALALELYQGDFLAGFHLAGCPDFGEWMEAERARLRRTAAAAAWKHAAHLLEARGLASAEEVALRALALDPADETAARTFMEALGAAGGRAAALRFYGALSSRLAVEVGVGPSAPTHAAARRMREDPGGTSARDAGGPAASPPTTDRRPSLAVLPFRTFSEDPAAALFGLGVMDDVLMRVSQVRGLRVVSRQSTLRYEAGEKSVPEIARELGVTTVLEGSIRLEGGRVRVVAQLIDGGTDGHLWAEGYEREIHDVFRVQTEIAECIVRALRSELTEEERALVRRAPTRDVGAWASYVHAVQSYQDLGPVELDRARDLLAEAVRLDPGFAKAWALMAEVQVLRAFCAAEPASALFPGIRAAAERALELDPRCGEAHAALGIVHLFHGWRAGAAEGEFRWALELNPDDTLSLGWWAIFLALQGRSEEALQAARQGVAADPLSAAASLVLGQVLVMAGRPEEAAAALEEGVERWPRALQLLMWLGLAYVFSERPEAALPCYGKALALSGHLPHFQALWATGLAGVGRLDEARAVLEELKARALSGHVDPYSLFSAALVLEGPEAALPHLDEMLRDRSVFLPYLRGIPRFRPLLGHPRFREAVDRVWADGTVAT